MKVCIFTRSIFKLGGTKRVITMVANEMAKEHDVTLVTFDDPKIENRGMYGLGENIRVEFEDSLQYKDNKFSVGGLFRTACKVLNNMTGIFDHGSGEFIKYIFFPGNIRKRYIEYFNAKDYDVIITTAGLIMLLAAISDDLKAKTVGWQHNCYDAYVNQKSTLFWKKNSFIRRYIPRLDRFVVLNHYDADEYKKQMDIDCEVIGNARSFVSEKKSDCTAKKFFVAARFVEAKGLDLLLRSYAMFCEKNKEWKMVIAGDGEDRLAVLDLAWRLGIQNRIEFTGIIDNVQDYYLDSSVYLLSSKWEGWGLVVIEAFEMGIPVIAYDIVPIDVLITNGEDGYIIEQFDAPKFAAAMTKLANDEALRKRMSQNAIKKAEKFSIDNIYQLWHDLLESVQNE